LAKGARLAKPERLFVNSLEKYMPENNLLLEVKDLHTYFFTQRGVVRAVNGVSFDIQRGHTLGVVGESGCGKSITSLSILQLLQKPGRIVGGKILFHADNSANGAFSGEGTVDITTLSPDSAKMRSIRGGQIAMIFQEPMTSLDPVYTVGDQIIEGIRYHMSVSYEEAREMARAMLARVNMPDPLRVLDSYPHQLSGGMRQRAMIAMALACGPSLLIADEPTTALDVTTEAQILELLRDLQQDLGMAILYITHNLGVVAEMVEEAIIMYLGKVVERGTVEAIFNDPKHPYLQALLRSVPRLGQKSGARLEAISGMVPSPFAIPNGCAFHPRCLRAIPGLCNVKEPPVADFGGKHWARCFLYEEVAS
jgi:peptide/nickel transport system ATP-binding protein